MRQKIWSLRFRSTQWFLAKLLFYWGASSQTELRHRSTYPLLPEHIALVGSEQHCSHGSQVRVRDRAKFSEKMLTDFSQLRTIPPSIVPERNDTIRKVPDPPPARAK